MSGKTYEEAEMRRIGRRVLQKSENEDKNSKKKGIEDGMTNPRQDADMTPGKGRFITNRRAVS